VLETKRMELEQAKLALEMRKIEAAAMGVDLGDTEGQEGTEEPPLHAGRVGGTLATQTKRYGDIMRHVLPKLPKENSELPQFFETAEKLFEMYGVPDEVKAKLLIPLLTTKALVNRLSIDKLADYAEVKQFLLLEYKLTPREYKDRFDTAVKGVSETYMLFAARLRNLFTYYLSSRGITKLESLCDLLISDRLKAALPKGPLNYVLSLEGEDWFAPDKVASLADMFTNNQGPVGGHKGGDGKNGRIATAALAENKGYSGTYGNRGGRFHQGRGGIHTSPGKQEQLRCYRCNGTGHMAKDCPSDRRPYCGNHRGGSFGGQGSTRGQRGSARVNLCSTMGAPQLQSKEMGVQCCDDDIQVNLVTKLPPESFPFGEFPSVDTVATVKTLPAVRVYPLQHINVSVAGYDCVALNDSGCQIPVVSNRLFGWCQDGAIGKVNLHGYGKDHTIQAPLVNLTVCLQHDVCEDDGMNEIPIVCAIADFGTTDYDVILPADVVKELQAVNVSVCTLDNIAKGITVVPEEVQGDSPESLDRPAVVEDSKQESPVDPDNQDCGFEGDVSALANEQRADPTLERCWAQAAEGKGGFVTHRGLL